MANVPAVAILQWVERQHQPRCGSQQWGKSDGYGSLIPLVTKLLKESGFPYRGFSKPGAVTMDFSRNTHNGSRSAQYSTSQSFASGAATTEASTPTSKDTFSCCQDDVMTVLCDRFEIKKSALPRDRKSVV